ncbi:MAG: hypothetical protein NVS1B1_00230 [Candidatus Limnocylindrales bacterium]
MGPRFVRDLLRSARRPRVLRRCSLIALTVGTLLTVVNQLDVVTAGRADLSLIGKVVANYLIPFVVSNLGALSASDVDATR